MTEEVSVEFVDEDSDNDGHLYVFWIKWASETFEARVRVIETDEPPVLTIRRLDDGDEAIPPGPCPQHPEEEFDPIGGRCAACLAEEFKVAEEKIAAHEAALDVPDPPDDPGPDPDAPDGDPDEGGSPPP